MVTGNTDRHLNLMDGEHTSISTLSLNKLKSHFLLESGRFDIFEIVMVSKILHFYIFYFSFGQYEFLNFFSHFDDSFPSYD